MGAIRKKISMLIFADSVGGFYATAAQATSGFWNSFTGTIHTSGLPAGNIGPTAASFGPNSGGITVPTAAGPYTLGMRFISTNAYGSSQEICRFYDASNNQQVTFSTDSGGTITAKRGTFGSGTVLGTSSGTTMTQNVWDYVEFQVTVSATVGTVAVRINGATVLTLTNINTLGGGGAAVIGKIAIGSNQTNFIQDLYIVDSTGSHNNTFLGDVHVSAFTPTSNGTYTDYTPNGAASLYQCVNATTPTDSTVFASDSNPGDKMSVNLAPSSVAGTIAAVVNIGRMKKTDSGTRTANLFALNGGTEVDGSSIALGTSYAYYQQVLEVDPNTGVPFTNLGFTTLQLGVETLT